MLSIAPTALLADLALPVLLVGGAVVVIVLLLIVFVLLEQSSHHTGAARVSSRTDVAGSAGAASKQSAPPAPSAPPASQGWGGAPAQAQPPAPPAPSSGALYSEWQPPEPTRSAPPPPPAAPPLDQSPPTSTPSPLPTPSASAPQDAPISEKAAGSEGAASTEQQADDSEATESSALAEGQAEEAAVAAAAALGAYAAEDGRLRGVTDADKEAVIDAYLPAAAPSAPPPAPAGPATAAQLQFTSYYPREVPPLEWQTLLVYAHVAEALADVRADVARFADELGERPRSTSALATQAVERGTTLTLVPSCAGVHFNPERLPLSWDEDWQRGSFRFQADAELAGSAAAGEIVVYVGPLILAVLKVGLLVSDTAQQTAPVVGLHQETAGTQSVFASYSHDDTPVVLACRNAYRALGLTVNLDVDSLRAGEHWGPRLMDLIESSDIFQLFWSAHAAASSAVEREWRYALSRSHAAGYIRPVYWEQPLIPPPPELADMHFAYVELPHS